MSGADELIARLQHRIAVLEGQLGKTRGAVHDRDEFLRRAFEDAPIGTALVGLDEHIVEANAALCQMLGYTREELLQRTVPEITHPDDVVKEAQPKGEMEDGEATSFLIEKRYLRRDGTELLGRLTVSALFDEHAKPAYFIGQLEDVTRERAAEEALREREALFRALIESTSEIFCIVDERATLQFVSPRVVTLGWSVEEVVGTSFEELLSPEDVPEFASALTRLLSDPSHALRMDARLRRRSGEERRFELFGHTLQSAQVAGGVVLTLRDVTEQRGMQAQLSQAQRLDGLARLVGGVAHDFNNMLSVIQGVSELMATKLDEGDPLRGDLDLVIETAERAGALTRQLLAIGRRSHGSARNTDVHETLGRMRALLTKLVGEDVTLDLQLAASIATILIDPTQLEQVVLNLATNARDAIQGRGRITVSTASRVVDAVNAPLGSRPGRYLELGVTDTGMGMLPEIAEQIFDPFFTTKNGDRGTGLGLATVYGIVQQAGGQIRVESEPGRGSRFTIWWPEARDDGGTGAVAVPCPTNARAHILLVEDDPNVRRVTEQILRSGGHEVTSFAEPTAALAGARAGLAFDIVVTDVVMPEMSGPELYREIKALLGEVPVVFVSGYAKAEISELSRHPGFLAKPFSATALLGKVAGQLRAKTR